MDPDFLELIPDEYTNKEMCQKAVESIPYTFCSVSDRYVTLKTFEDFENDDIITWCNGYK